MTIERTGRSKSPVHVYVDDQLPVHVHMQKPWKQSGGNTTDPKYTSCDTKAKSSSKSEASNLRRSTAAVRQSRSPPEPWVPPPGKTTRDNKYSWQGASHRLEINTPQAALLRNDLSTEDEDILQSNMRKYEDKIDGLMAEVGTLKNEVKLQRTVKELERKGDELNMSRKCLEHQESEIEEYRRSLEDTEAENRILRRSFEMNSNRGEWTCDREKLMKKLVEVEMDGQAATKQASSLKDFVRHLKDEKRITQADLSMLNRQKEMLLDRLIDFEKSNHILRNMLREHHEKEAEGLCLSEQRDMLLQKLSESEDNVQRYRTAMLDKERSLGDIRTQAEAQRDENMALMSLQGSLESTRGHLQKQLRQKEGDCNRLAVQVRTLESQLAQEKIEVDHLTGLLTQAKEKSDEDKDALKKATRVQKNRAVRSEDALEQLNGQVLDRDAHIAELRSNLNDNLTHYNIVSKDKEQLQAENATLKTRMNELENIMLTVEDSSKAQVEGMTARLHNKTSESANVKLENERLKTSLITIEDKLTQADTEVAQLRASIRQYETLIDEYRTQMNKSRMEADETMTILDQQKSENKRIGMESDVELDKVKTRLQTRLVELEPIPALLKTTELKLQDASERILMFDRRNTDNTKLIAELTAKVETQADQLRHLHGTLHKAHDSNHSSHTRFESTERKLIEAEEQNADLLKNLAKRDETIHQVNMRLDEKTRESASLNRQLESILADSRRVGESAREKAASKVRVAIKENLEIRENDGKILCKERTRQARILELESQLSQSRTEMSRIKREKEEAERKFNSRLYDVKERLEQSHNTNRSMQNYVQFLKSSYANVFGDQSQMTSSPIRNTFY